MRAILIFLALAPIAANASGTLTDDIRISSDTLGYDLQFRVYLPDDPQPEMPVLFVTDGPGYISRGRMPQVIDTLVESGSISPLVVVFVDPRDPDNRRNNRRNDQFLCNPEYLSFYQRELIPRIEESYSVGNTRDHRGILGLSFGATNAACFGLLGYETFSLIGMHSPANHPIKGLLPAYEESPLQLLRMFLSTGTPDDNTRANRQFRNVLEEKGYDVKYVEVREGHNWNNWGPLVDDVLVHFYGTHE